MATERASISVRTKKPLPSGKVSTLVETVVLSAMSHVSSVAANTLLARARTVWPDAPPLSAPPVLSDTWAVSWREWRPVLAPAVPAHEPWPRPGYAQPSAEDVSCLGRSGSPWLTQGLAELDISPTLCADSCSPICSTPTGVEGIGRRVGTIRPPGQPITTTGWQRPDAILLWL